MLETRPTSFKEWVKTSVVVVDSVITVVTETRPTRFPTSCIARCLKTEDRGRNNQVFGFKNKPAFKTSAVEESNADAMTVVSTTVSAAALTCPNTGHSTVATALTSEGEIDMEIMIDQQNSTTSLRILP